MKEEKRNRCSFCGKVVFVEREGIQSLVFQKWGSCIKVWLSARVKSLDVHSQLFIEQQGRVLTSLSDTPND